MNVTGQALITEALTRLGINEQGGIPSVSDSNAALTNLNSWWEGMSIDEGLINAVQRSDFALSAGIGTYPIGPTAAAPFNVPLPSRIYRAFIVTGTQQNELDVVSQEKYYSHNDLTATSSTPDELYADYNVVSGSGLSSLFLYPVPSGAPSLRLVYGATFGTWTLVSTYDLPPAYFDLLAWGLAFRSLSTFGVAVKPEVAEAVTLNGKMADEKVRVMNSKNRQMPAASMGTPMTSPPPVPGKAA